MEDLRQTSFVGCRPRLFLLSIACLCGGCLAAFGFGTATAFGQSVGGLTTTVGQITSTVGSVAGGATSTTEGAVDDASEQAEGAVGSISGGGTSGGGSGSGGSGSGGSGSGGSGSGGSGGGSVGDGGSNQASPSAGRDGGSKGPAASIPATCAEAAGDPRSLALFIATLKEDQAPGTAGDPRSKRGVAAAKAGSEPEAAGDVPLPSLVPQTDAGRSLAAIVAWAIVGLGIATLLASMARFWTGRWSP